MASGLIDLRALLSQKVISGSRSTTAQNVRDFEREFLSSALNIVDGGLVVQALAGYSSILTPTDPKHWTSKKYVDDAIAGATPTGVLFAANNLSDLSNASAARTNLGVAIGSNVQAYSANLDSWSVLATTAKLSVDGSLSMTGDLDLNSHDLKRVSQIKDPSGVVSLVPSTRLLKDSSGNTIAIWGSQTNGFGIQTASWAAYLKGTNLSQVSTFEFPNVVSGTLALTSDLTSYLTGVTGTTNRITSSGGTTPVIDISASYVGQSSITTVGTIGTGVWQGTAITGTYLDNAGVIGKVLTGYVSGAGTITTADSILQAIQKLNGNDGLKLTTTLASANIIVGNVSNIATAVSMSGDVTIDNTGATTIGANKVTYQKSYNGNQMSIVATMKLLTGN